MNQELVHKLHDEFVISFPNKEKASSLLYRELNPAVDLVDRLNQIQEKFKLEEEISDEDLLIIYAIWLQDKLFTLTISTSENNYE